MPTLPSLNIVEDVVVAESEAQERRGDALDSKAGLILGFAGVLAVLAPDDSAVLVLLGRAVAVLAALLALFSLSPRPYPRIGPRQLRMRYLTSQPDDARLSILDTRITNFEQTEATLRTKATCVQGAFVALALSTLLTVLGVSV